MRGMGSRARREKVRGGREEKEEEEEEKEEDEEEEEDDDEACWRLGSVAGLLGGLFEASGGGPLGSRLRYPGVLGTLWGLLGDLLGASWGHVGNLGGHLVGEGPGGPFELPLLGASWVVVEASWAVWVLSWAVSGLSWGPLTSWAVCRL